MLLQEFHFGEDKIRHTATLDSRRSLSLVEESPMLPWLERQPISCNVLGVEVLSHAAAVLFLMLALRLALCLLDHAFPAPMDMPAPLPSDLGGMLVPTRACLSARSPCIPLAGRAEAGRIAAYMAGMLSMGTLVCPTLAREIPRPRGGRGPRRQRFEQ